jgi:transmembrane sensor
MLPAAKRNKLLRLMKKYVNGTATPEEIDFVERYYAHFDNLSGLADSLEGMDRVGMETQLLAKIDARIGEMETEGIEQSPTFAGEQAGGRSLYRRLYVGVAATAAVLLLLVAGVFLYRDRRPVSTGATRQAYVMDFSPGRTGAILVFERSGRKIVLDTARNGAIGDGVVKSTDNISINRGEGAGDRKKAAVNGEGVEYALLSTPKARIQELTLPDGTVAWLNAASSIRFPTRFTGNERLVEITGEVDFKVVHNDRMPFRVKARGLICEDIGTEFNINAYEDEPFVKATLLEGIVRANGYLLKPGQQAVVNNTSSPTPATVVKNADTEQAVAWKNGLFSFNERTDLYTVMRQIGRWYDVEIVYEGPITPMQFGGKIPRSANASEVLKILAYSNVHFRIEGKKIIVMP